MIIAIFSSNESASPGALAITSLSACAMTVSLISSVMALDFGDDTMPDLIVNPSTGQYFASWTRTNAVGGAGVFSIAATVTRA